MEREAFRIQQKVNDRWRLKTGALSETDGFQVEAVTHRDAPSVVLLMATLYGGAGFIGEPRKVEVVCRHHVMRVRKRKPK